MRVTKFANTLIGIVMRNDNININERLLLRDAIHAWETKAARLEKFDDAGGTQTVIARLLETDAS